MFRTFSGKTPCDLARGKPALYSLFQRYLPGSLHKEPESIHSPVTLFTEGNFCPKHISNDLSQLSIDSNKFSDPTYDIPTRETTSKDSPNKNVPHINIIYTLLWPQPKTIIDLKNCSSPFIAGKELFITIIQVRIIVSK